MSLCRRVTAIHITYMFQCPYMYVPTGVSTPLTVCSDCQLMCQHPYFSLPVQNCMFLHRSGIKWPINNFVNHPNCAFHPTKFLLLNFNTASNHHKFTDISLNNSRAILGEKYCQGLGVAKATVCLTLSWTFLMFFSNYLTFLISHLFSFSQRQEWWVTWIKSISCGHLGFCVFN